MFKDISIITWNIWCATIKCTLGHVRDMISNHRPYFFMLFQTYAPFSWVNEVWETSEYHPVFLQVTSHSGAIWILSNKKDLTYNLIHQMEQSITFSIHKGTCVFVCSAIYASPNPSMRTTLWDHLVLFGNSIHDPWLMMGDMNDIISTTKVIGDNFMQIELLLWLQL